MRSLWTRAALDVTAAVKWMRRRYQGLPLGYVSHSYGGKGTRADRKQLRDFAALFVASQAAMWKLMTPPES